MCAKIGQQQRENWNIFTQNLANHFNMFFYRLEGTSKDKSIPVTDAETSNPSCLKATAYNRDTQGSFSKAITNNRDLNNKKEEKSALKGG